MQGEVIEVDPPRSLAFTWGDDMLRIELEGDDDGCVLHFVVLFDDAERASRDAAGWHVCLDRLERHLGGAATRSPTARRRPTGVRATRSTSAAACRPGHPSRATDRDRPCEDGAWPTSTWPPSSASCALATTSSKSGSPPWRARPSAASQVGFGKRIGDGTTEAVSRLTDVGVGGSLELSEARVARALAKLAEGSYGVCDGCGEPIAPARLAAAPESVLCIECARRAR